jgi:hypothetical protein
MTSAFVGNTTGIIALTKAFVMLDDRPVIVIEVGI